MPRVSRNGGDKRRERALSSSVTRRASSSQRPCDIPAIESRCGKNLRLNTERGAWSNSAGDQHDIVAEDHDVRGVGPDTIRDGDSGPKTAVRHSRHEQLGVRS